MKLKRTSELKNIAKQRLKNCWCECFGIFLLTLGVAAAYWIIIIMLINFLYAFDVISMNVRELFESEEPLFYCAIAAAMILLNLLAAPLKYGVCWYFIQTVRGNAVPASCFFSCYMHPKHLKNLMLLEISVFLRKLAAGAPLLAVMIGVTLYFGRENSGMPEGASGVFLTVFVIMLIISLFYIYVHMFLRYSAVPFVYALGPDKKRREIISESVQALNNNELYLLEVLLSFCGWLSVAIFIVPLLCIEPYVYMTFTAAINELLTSFYSEKQDLDALKMNVEAYENSEREENILV